MKSPLQFLQLDNFSTESGYFYPRFELSYQVFGRPLGKAPVVMVNHALTGNSNVAGTDGWWRQTVGPGLGIDTDRFSVIAFNVPGNGYDGKAENLIRNYADFTARDVARLFGLGLQSLGISRLHALVGGSLGGGIAWEMAFLFPDLSERLIPVAADWKASDWIIAHNKTQQQILSNSSQPVHDARMMAMLFYRTAESFKRKFNRARQHDPAAASAAETARLPGGIKGEFKMESWLLHHGKELESRFRLESYQMMNHLLSTIDVTRGRGAFPELAPRLQAEVLQIAIDSDFFFVPQEIRETKEILDRAGVNNHCAEIHSVHGHDAFLIEFEQLNSILGPFLTQPAAKRPAGTAQTKTVVKFGGRSLANGAGFRQVVKILEGKFQSRELPVVVVSARGQCTDELLALLELARQGRDFRSVLADFADYQQHPLADQGDTVDLTEELHLLEKYLDGVSLLRDISPRVRDQVLALGELMAIKALTAVLKKRGLPAVPVDARKLIRTDDRFGQAQVDMTASREATRRFFSESKALGAANSIPVVTGFIGATASGETTTLGRNGSNYSAALLASFLGAKELQNYTHVDGIFTANPEVVPGARPIQEMTYSEASELARHGARILHAKTIAPLVAKNIPLRIRNTFEPDKPGTVVKARVDRPGIRAVTVQEPVALVTLYGRGLLGKVGVDARIFTCLAQAGINVGVISQGSSERGIGLVVSEEDATRAKQALDAEFAPDRKARDVDYVDVRKGLGVVSIIGQELGRFHRPYASLVKNGTVPVLMNSTVTGDTIFLVLEKSQLNKAVNVIHSKIFGVSTVINLVLFGKGQVGSALIEQILASRESIEKRRGVRLNIVAVADSQRLLLAPAGIDRHWRQQLQQAGGQGYTLNDIIRFVRGHHLENLVAVDNTASKAFVANYLPLVENGFDLVSSNKNANTLDYGFYQRLRQTLKKHEKQYLYETNVGAGLPLIDTIRLLHDAGENITAIKGIFSGSLSYLFNLFSEQDRPFSVILREAMEKGLTEPDPREDLSGNDVARKLLVLARELDLRNELSDVAVENLIPADLHGGTREEFLARLERLDAYYDDIKARQKPGHVLRYVGELGGDLQQDTGELSVKLVSVPRDSALGQVREADSVFEIHTESYGQRPIVIQGAGAGADVTARGVLGDILRLSEKAG